MSRRYRIERELGRGGMGIVYLGLDLKHQRRVAIKVLPPDLAMALGPERFLREIRISAGLSHPHILPLHDSGQVSGVLYYIMPLVAGESLRQRLRREACLPIETAITITEGVADALRHAHDVGVVHRDIKPENILLSGDHALLTDFGVARAVSAVGSDKLTDSGLLIGTAAYMSPEQASGSAEVDGRSDIYSLGCVLYEMLAGSQSAEPILGNRFSQTVPFLRTIRPEVPEAMAQAVSRAMASSPGDRFANAGAFRDALRSTPTPLSVAGSTQLRSRRTQWQILALVILVAIVLAAAFLPPRTTSGPSRRVLVALVANRTGSDSFAPLGDIATDYIARGLATTRLLDEVFDARTEPRELAGGREGAAGVREMARALGAGTAVWGSYYRLDDSVHFEAHILDVSSGKVLLSLQPVAGPANALTAIVETLRQRVMAGFAAIFGKGFDAWQAQSIPPTFAAYQEVLAGEEAGWQFNYGDALKHYRRGAALDPGYTGAATNSALILALLNRCGEVDSVADLLTRNPTPLPPMDQGQLDYALAICRGDAEKVLEAARAVLRIAPRSIGASVLTAINALETFRPREAIGILTALHPIPTEFIGLQEGMYWSFQQYAYHMMGDFERELATARNPHQPQGGDLFGEAVALAGLRRTPEVEQLAGEIRSRENIYGWGFGALAQCLALELHGHGQFEASTRLMEQAESWFQRHPPETTMSNVVPPCLWHMLSSVYYAGHWDTARRVYQAMANEDTTDVRARFGLGAVAAHQGDSAEAGRMDRWLNAHGEASYDRARLAAIRGDRAGAVALIQRAFHEHFGGRLFMHTDPDLDSLRGYPPYEELLRPRD